MTTQKKIATLPGLGAVVLLGALLYVTQPFIFFFLAMLSAIVFLHEGGHYFAGRALKVKIEQFSIGFGPIIAERIHKDVSYSIRAFPLGGFVEFDKTSMKDLKPWKEIIISLAGPAVNFASPVIALTGIMLFKDRSLINAFITSLDITYETTTEFFVGLQQLAGNTLQVFTELFGKAPGEDAIVTASRGGEILESSTREFGRDAYITIFSILSVAIGALNLLPFGPLDGYNVLSRTVDAVVYSVTGKTEFVFKETKASQIYMSVGVAYLLIVQFGVVALELKNIPPLWLAFAGSLAGTAVMVDRIWLKPDVETVPVTRS